MTLTKNTCILFFSRTPESEARYKQLHPAKRKNITLHKLLYDQALEKIKKSKIDFQVVSEQKQFGVSFGEKLGNAVEKVFSKYENVIILGNDCPELNSIIINDTCRLLNEGFQVLGKEKDGGAYLIGLKKLNWDKNKFINLPWNTSQLFSTILSYFSNKKHFVLEETFLDVDNYQSLTSVIKASSMYSIWRSKLKKFILYRSNPYNGYVCQYSDSIHLNGISFRGPPIHFN